MTQPANGTGQYVALLLRGQTFRWGCNPDAVSYQRDAVRSQQTMLLEPLKLLGYEVHTFLVLDARGCNRTLDGALTEMHTAAGERVVTRVVGLGPNMQLVKWDQPRGVRAALNFFLDSGNASAYDYLVMTRHDVRLLQPLPKWRCRLDPNMLLLANHCEPHAWRQFNCSNDVLHIVPRAHLAAFNSSIGWTRTKPKSSRVSWCCFEHHCIQQSGHGCFNALSRQIPASQMGFCWPGARRKISEANEFWTGPRCFENMSHKIWRCGSRPVG